MVMKWIKFGWGESFTPTFNNNLKLYANISDIQYTSKPLLEVSAKVINDITKNYPEPYYLMVSGGIDSQALLWCWMNSGKNFIPISVRYTGALEYKNILNQHDLDELDTFASANNLTIKYIDFNIINFLENDLEDYAVKYQCTSPQLCTHMKISELVNDGTVIFSGNFMRDAFYTYTILGLKRYADTSNRNIIPFFFLHDNELAGLRGNNDYDRGYKEKVRFYKDLGIPVIPQVNKLTGFEVIKDYYDTRTDLTVTGIEKLKYANKDSKRKFDIIFRYRLGEKIKYQDKIVIVSDNNTH
jgi:hypothetical protein